MSRYDLSELEWGFIKPVLPTKVRGVKRVDDRRVLNGIFYILRTGCAWRDLPERYGPYTTVYNRFNRWVKAGVWDRIMDAVVDAHNGDVVMIDSSSVRVHHAAATVKKTVHYDVWVVQEAD
jgi:transposase